MLKFVLSAILFTRASRSWLIQADVLISLKRDTVFDSLNICKYEGLPFLQAFLLFLLAKAGGFTADADISAVVHYRRFCCECKVRSCR